MIDNLISEADRLLTQNAPTNNISRVMADIEIEIKLLIANSSRNNNSSRSSTLNFSSLSVKIT